MCVWYVKHSFREKKPKMTTAEGSLIATDNVRPYNSPTTSFGPCTFTGPCEFSGVTTFAGATTFIGSASLPPTLITTIVADAVDQSNTYTRLKIAQVANEREISWEPASNYAGQAIGSGQNGELPYRDNNVDWYHYRGIRLPSDYAPNTPIKTRFYWNSVGAGGNVLWRVGAGYCGLGDVPPPLYGLLDVAEIIAPASTGLVCSTVQHTQNDMQPGDYVFMRLLRYANDPLDTSSQNSSVYGVFLVYTTTQ